MNQEIEIPGIKKVLYEQVFVHGCQQHMTTKVYFKGGSALTFAGSLDRKKAIREAYFQKGRDAGMTMEEAEVFADSKIPSR